MSAKIFLSILTFFCIAHTHALTRIGGNNQSRGADTFSFGIKQMYVTPDQRMIVAAQEVGAQEFALCALESGAGNFRPLAQETIIHNGQKDQKNPLYDAAVAHIAPLNNTNIAIIAAHDPTKVYSHHFGLFKSHLFSTTSITDASGTHVTSGITALAAGDGFAFIAVKGHKQEHFGDGDSGIALVRFSEIKTEQELDQKALEKIKEDGKNVTAAEQQEIQNAIFQDKDGKTKKRVTTFGFAQANTAPLNNACNVLKGENSDVKIEEVTDLYYSPALERVYVACKVSGSGNTCAIAVGHVDTNGNLQLTPIIHPDLCNEASVVGSNDNAPKTIYKVKTLQTSTGYLDYLIILADEWPLGERKRVYALPLLNFKQVDGTIALENSNLHGTLAHTYSSLSQAYGPNNVKTGKSAFLGRHFNQAPLSAQNVLMSFDQAAHVGGGAALFEDISVQGDCVYAIVNESEDDESPSGLKKGVYQSQAIFAYDGRIATWTNWKRVCDFSEHIASYTIDGAAGGALVSSGIDAQKIRSVSRTGWSDQHNDFLEKITKEFPKEMGGIQRLFDFSSGSSGYLCVTGKEKIMLVPMHSNDSSENEKLPTLIINNIPDMGSIIAAEYQEAYPGVPWIGGAGGLAVLDINLSTEENMLFKKVGDFSFVKKIIAQGQYLYILSDTALDRIDLAQSDIKNNHYSIIRLAVADDLLSAKNAYFYDCIVAGPLALLAHNKGLSRIANNHDVRFDDIQTIAWTNIPLTSKSQPCIALLHVNIAKLLLNLPGYYNVGQVYAVCGSKQEYNAKVYRLAVTQTQNISDETVMPLNDYVIKDQPPFYFDLKSYTPGFFTDGTRSFITQNKKQNILPVITTHYGSLQHGKTINLPDATQITDMVRCSANGKWFVAGDFGLVVNE